MPVYRCNKCGHISEAGVAGTQVPCATCQNPCNVYDTAFFVGKLIERYAAAMREIKSLQADEKEIEESAQDSQDVNASINSETDSLDLATAKQHLPIEKWLQSRQVKARFDYSNVDMSGYFDEAAQQMGERYELFGELIQRVNWSYRKVHTGLNIDLSAAPQKDIKELTTLCRQFYSHTLFSRYVYQKQEKIMRLGLQPAPKIRQFFEGAWLEWYALMVAIEQFKRRKIGFSCARSVELTFPNEDLHELDVILLPQSQAPIYIECKTGEFRREIDKYQRLRKRLDIDPRRFIICATELSNEQASSLNAMYDLTFVNLSTLEPHLFSLN